MHPDVYIELFEDEMGLDTMGLTNLYPDLVEVIQKRTLPVFSEMFPCVYPYLLDPSDKSKRIADEYGGNVNEYRIEDPVLESYVLKVISYQKLYPAYKKDPYAHGYNNMYIGGMGDTGMNYDDILLGTVISSTRSTIRQAVGMNPTCKLKGSNVLAIKNFADFAPYIVELIVTYPNINSIAETYKRFFMNLAKYDVGIYLYQKMKYVEDVVTPAGNLNLKISDWESFPREKEDYIKELLTLSFPDRVMDNYFMAI